ncbi:MAG: Ppx/GppA phosphatase family protein [Pseudomonadota bacterium]
MVNLSRKTLPLVSNPEPAALAVQGRLPDLQPVGILDIGSNSVRLVVYEGLTRSPTPLYNEKVLAGLGRSVASDGVLDEAALEKAYGALRRFRWLADQLNVKTLLPIATAAVRDASNGDAFLGEAEAICKTPIRVLSGEEEAHYSALGVISGFHNPKGVVADLGGGSLELVRLDGDWMEAKQTLPMGALRLKELSGDVPAKAREIVKEVLSKAHLPPVEKDDVFYAVGGTWRAFAKIHMAVQEYPLAVLQNYRIKTKHAISLAREIRTYGMRNLPGITAVSSARRDLLPYGAIVLEEVLKALDTRDVFISALGVREGVLFSMLDGETAEIDPLISAAQELCVLRARSPEFSAELCEWTDRLVRAIGMEEDESDTRLRHAACWLADVGWRAHPEYRGEQTLSKIANAAFVGVDHAGRAFLALTIFFRHAGNDEELPGPRLRGLVDLETMGRARAIGAMFRVAYRMSAAMPGVLPRIAFERRGSTLVMLLPQDLAAIAAERINSRLKKLALSVGLTAEIEIFGGA